MSGAVLVLLDVTEREQGERMRREFTANVSHELKTPLTAISGMAEIIKNGMVKPKDVAGFAGDIYKESQRLISLVEDIIHLSRLDEGGVGLETGAGGSAGVVPPGGWSGWSPCQAGWGDVSRRGDAFHRPGNSRSAGGDGV